MLSCLITLGCLAVELLAKFWPEPNAPWRRLAEKSGLAAAVVERAKQRAVIKMTVERLLAEERLRYLLQSKQRAGS